MDSKDIELRLGDIIRLHSPSNKDYDDKIFFIEYIDADVIVIVNDTEKHHLTRDGSALTDESIDEIHIISRANSNSYVRQNGIETGDYLSIYFSGKEPYVLNGTITNIEEDMIEISRVEDSEKFYIDFAYQGIPRDSNIERIDVNRMDSTDYVDSVRERDEAESMGSVSRPIPIPIPMTDGDEMISDEVEKNDGELDDDQDEPGPDDILDDYIHIEPQKVDISNVIKKSGVLVFGEMVDDVIQKFNVSESETRFGIDNQVGDMFNTMKSDVNEKRDDRILKQIVQRYQELRSEFSIFNEYGNIIGIVKRDDSYKPIVDAIKKMETNISWLLPIVKQKLNVYISSVGKGGDIDDTLLADEFDDVVPISDKVLTEDKRRLKSSKEFKSTPDTNGYYAYLNELHKFMLPYSPSTSSGLYDIDISNHAIEAMVDNDGKYGMTAYTDGSSAGKLNTYRYGIQRYSTSLAKKRFVDMKNPLHSHTILSNNDPEETMKLTSIVTLPSRTVLHERINCGSTSIKDRVDISQTPFIRSFFMKYDFGRELHVIDNFKTTNLQKQSFFKNATEHIKEVITDISDVNERDSYNNYFDYIFPTNMEFFRQHQKNMKKVYNLNHLISELEVFKISREYLTPQQYKLFLQYIDERLIEYNRRMRTYKEDFNNYKIASTKLSQTIQRDNTNVENHIDSILGKRWVDHTIHEKIGMVSKFDKLFYAGIDKNNMNLNSTKNINESLEYFVGKLEQAKQGTDDDCDDEFIIAREYVTEESLHDDDGNDVYYDKKFDNTIYDLLDVYKTEQMSMDPVAFKTFMIKKLMDVNGISAAQSKYDTETLVDGKKKVRDGAYAILQNMTGDNRDDFKVEYSFYKRINDKWILDSKKTNEYKDDGPIIMENGSNFVCNLKKTCIKKSGECGPVGGVTTDTKRDLIRRMLGEFDHRFYMERGELVKYLNEEIIRGENNKSRVEQLYEIDELKYVSKYNAIAAQYDETGLPAKSPYLDALELVIGIGDLSLKNEQILKFSNTLTRSPTHREDKNWRYCIETNLKLMPMFLHRLSHAYHVGNYSVVLDAIAAGQGKISDDGEAIIDEHSGRIIRYRELMRDDDEGVAVFLKDVGIGCMGGGDTIVPETDVGDFETELEMDVFQDDCDKRGVDGDVIDVSDAGIPHRCDDLVSAIIKEMKVNLTKETHRFVVYHATNAFLRNVGTSATTTKETFQLLVMVCSALFIGIQISRTRTSKSFPGCVVTFDGYPLDASGGTDGIAYMACCILKISGMRRKTGLFSELRGVKHEKLTKLIGTYISTLFVTNIDIALKLDEKRRMVEHDAKIVYGMDSFVFMPSLYVSDVNIVKTLPASFYDEMKTKRLSGKDAIYIYLNRLKSKNIEIGHGFVKIINDQLKMTDAMLTRSDEPYTENTCCLEAYNTQNVLNYFNQKDGALFKYAEMSRTNSNICDDFVRDVRASVLATRRTQVAISPFIQTQFDEKTIYTSFIKYCKWNKTSNTFSIRGDINDICQFDRDEFAGEMTIEKKIHILKAANKNLTNSMLLVLINKINKMNIVDVEGPSVSRNMIDVYTSFLKDHGDNLYVSKISGSIIDFTNTFDISKPSISLSHKGRTKASFQTDSVIVAETNKLQADILSFIRDNSEMLDKKDYSSIQKFMNEFDTYKTNGSKVFDGDVFLNKIRHYRNMIYEITRVIPNIIMNKKVHYDDESSSYSLIPKYWDLSNTHTSDLTKFNRKYYEWMNRLHDNIGMRDIFQACSESDTVVYRMSELTPLYSPKVDGSKVIYSVFDDVIVSSLYKFYMLSIFDNYIKVSTNTVYGEIYEYSRVKRDISAHIKDVMLHFAETKHIVDNDYSFIAKKILHYKESEKLRITNKLESIGDQEREVQNELKNNRLGEKWGKGLESGLVRYDPAVYERERAEDGSSDMFTDTGMDDVDVYMDDEDREINDLSHIGDDDDGTSYDD
jgi:hypothetical protein